jgi:ATP-binding cassette subfamily B multidrug efflux pump
MPRPGRSFAKPKNTKATFKRVLGYLKYYRVLMVLEIICIILYAASSAVGSMIIGYAIDKGVLPFIGKGVEGSPLKFYVLILIIVYVIGLVSSFLTSRFMIYIASGVMKRVRDDMFIHLQSLPISYFDKHTHGELMSRFTNDTDTLREMISNGIPNLISSVCSIIFVFVCMCIISIPLTILVLLFLIIEIKAIKYIVGHSRSGFIEAQKQIGTVNGYIEEMTEGQKVVKVFTHEEEVLSDFDELNNHLCDLNTKAQTYTMMLFPIVGNLSHVIYVIVGGVGSVLVYFTNQGAFANSGFFNWFLGLGAGFLITYLTYIRSFTQPITNVSQQFTGIITALAGSERIFDILDEKVEVDEGYVELVNCTKNEQGEIVECKERTGMWAWKHPHQADGTVSYTELKGDIVFEDVDFGYEPNKTILKDINLYARPGQKVAFVGSTGAGKTTITSLINRFYELQDGKIRYDGINIQKIKKADLRHSLAQVLQDTHLFTGTVMDNIRYGKLEATDEECIEAARLANADSFIKHLPQGYQTMLTSDGANLSQGQRQLLAIARAAVANPPVLILDEATSSIDTRTEALIAKGMDALMKGRTVFVIAHRLSTVRNSDAIMVLELGQIIERGNHDSLIEQKGKYYQLYTGKLELS